MRRTREKALSVFLAPAPHFLLRKGRKKREAGNAATKDNSCAAGGQRELLRRRTTLSPPGAERHATKLCPVLHEDRLVLHEIPLYPPPRCRTATSRASRGVPSPGTRCPMPARSPACFRERIYISRNRRNFYTT